MRGLFLLCAGVLACGGVTGAAVAIDQPFPSAFEKESVTDISSTVTPRAAKAVSATLPVSATAPAALGLVKGVVVTLSDTTGFARDVGLQKGARQALPTVLMRLPMAEADAQRIAKTVGDAKLFLKSYTIVKESILPRYTLTADLLYDEDALRKNFGGQIIKPLPGQSAVSSSAADVSAPASPQPTAALQTLKVNIDSANPADANDLYQRLSRQKDVIVTYASIGMGHTVLNVTSPLTQNDLQALVGDDATVELPAPVVPAAQPQAAAVKPDATPDAATPSGPLVGAPVWDERHFYKPE
jgi:hypothetical protein